MKGVKLGNPAGESLERRLDRWLGNGRTMFVLELTMNID